MGKGELVAEKLLAAPYCKNLVVLALDDENGTVPIFLNSLFGGRELCCGSVGECLALLTQRTLGAFGILDFANGSAQFHQGLVMHVGFG